MNGEILSTRATDPRPSATSDNCQSSLEQRAALKNQHVRKSELRARYTVQFVPVEQIKPSPENDEIYGTIDFDSDPALQSLVNSINRLGLEEPIICTADNYILSGHRRFAAVRHLGWNEVPVRFSKVRRADTADYHRLLAQYNPQRVKSVAAVLSEKLLETAACHTRTDFRAKVFEKSQIDAATIIVEGSKGVDPIGERQKEFLAAVVKVVGDLRDFWPLTVRQVHYKLLNAAPLTQVTRDRNERWRYKNDQASYNKLSGLLVSARYLAHVPIHAIDDPTRISKDSAGYTCTSPREFIDDELSNFLEGYQRHRLEGQPNHVELLIEKNTLLNIVTPVAEKFMLPYSVNRGYGNPSLWRRMEERWKESPAKRFILLTISDHDPEGFDLIDDAARSLRDLHDVPVKVVRVGLTMEQIQEQNAPPAFAKETSSRFSQYVKRTGSNECWEVEALDPRFLQEQLHENILSVLDVEQLNAVQEREAEELRQIDAIRRKLSTELQRLMAEEDGE